MNLKNLNLTMKYLRYTFFVKCTTSQFETCFFNMVASTQLISMSYVFSKITSNCLSYRYLCDFTVNSEKLV